MATDKDQGSYRLNGRTIRYTFEKSGRARKYRITYQEDGTFRITVPGRGRLPDPEALLFRHRRWISNRLRDAGRRRNPLPELADGRQIPLLGALWTLRIRIGSAGRPSWILHPGDRILWLSVRDHSGTAGLLGQWYRHMAGEYLAALVPSRAGRMGVRPAGFRIKNQRTIWGSCSHRRCLNFNWRITILSPEAAEYLIIHELAHLRHLNHSKAFWETVAHFCPDYKLRKREIREKNHWLLFLRGDDGAQ